MKLLSGLSLFIAISAFAQNPKAPVSTNPGAPPAGAKPVSAQPAAPTNPNVRAAPVTPGAQAAQNPGATNPGAQAQNHPAQPQANTPVGKPAQTSPVQTAPAQSAPAPVTSALPTHTDSAVESILSEDLIRALRDPFQLPSALLTKKDTPKTDLEIYPLKDFKLNGVITGPKKTRAMVTTPNNKVFFVRIGDKMGVRDGTVTQILPEAIKVVEYYVDEHGKRMPDIFELTMSGDLVSLNKKEE